jgi:hypothetical protein
MSQFCTRCGLPLSTQHAACQRCEPDAAAPLASAWGALDIQRGAPGVQRKSTEVAGARAEEPLRAAPRPVAPADANETRLPSRPAAAAAATRHTQAGSRPDHAALRGTPAQQRTTRGSTPQHPALRGAQARRTASRAITGTVVGTASGARAATGPVSLPTAGQATTGSLGPHSGAQATQEPQHPALRGSTPRHPALRAAAAPVAAPSAAAPSAVVSANDTLLDTGLTDFGERFSHPDNDQDAATLEIQAPAPAREAERKVAVPAPEDATARVARQVRQLAGYGPAPTKLLEVVPYFLRVTTRRRQLQAQAAQLTLQRKQMEHKAQDALCALGEALFAQRSDPRLSQLSLQIKIVIEARQQIGQQAAATKRGVQAQQRERAALSQQIDLLERQAAPVEARVNQLTERLQTGRGQIRELEQQQRKLEAEQKSLKAATDLATLERVAALEQARAAARGAIQSLNVELVPLTDDLTVAKGDLARRLHELAELTQQQQRLDSAVDRNEDRQRIAAGGVMAAHREALRSLANAGRTHHLAELAQAALKNVTVAELPIAAQRNDEELVRKAVTSYDHSAYQRGMQLVAGAVVGTFTLLLLLIAF